MKDQDQNQAGESVYSGTNRLFARLGPQLQAEGQEFKLGRSGVTMPHYPVTDTALAACLATLDIPLRDPAPYTDDVEVDEKGDEVMRWTVWWLADSSRSGGWPGPEGNVLPHKTEELGGAWLERERFEREYPLHPLVAMRESIDARAYWVTVIQTWLQKRAILPTEGNREKCYLTESIHSASLLKACGFKAVAFNKRTFFLERVHGGVEAQVILDGARLAEGAAPAQWMQKVLTNFSQMLDIAKRNTLIVRERTDPQTTVLLTIDAEKKTRDKFFRLV
jgi:hypothetical protein